MLDLTRDIHSLSNFKRRTSDFLVQMKQTREPVVLTVNGKAELIVQDAQSYQALLERLDYLESIAAIRQGMSDIDAGKTVPLEDFKKKLQDKYGFQD